MKASDVMTRDVVTVSPNDLVQDVARTLLKHRISGVPVVDQAGKIVGIVSEGDLMRRAETDTDAQRSWWLRAVASSETLATEYVRSHGRTAADIMTTRVLTASPETSLRDLAAKMERKHIKRLPIVENGKLVGIVSRANLMQAFATIEVVPAGKAATDDTGLREQVMQRIRKEGWSSPSTVNVLVYQGVVELWGLVNTESEHKAVRIVAESTPGVVSVKDNIAVGLNPSGI